eukprot:2374153-Heterocapsa_arctica.AAC.1
MACEAIKILVVLRPPSLGPCPTSAWVSDDPPPSMGGSCFLCLHLGGPLLRVPWRLPLPPPPGLLPP